MGSLWANEEINDPDVIVLTGANFEAETAKADLMLVEFYAPWCGHCKHLAPEYAIAATELLKEDPPVMLGKVDATVETELASQFSISGYPTLKMFRNGVEAGPYEGPRQADGIVKYMKALNGPAAKPLASPEDLDAFSTNHDDAGFVAFVESGSEEEKAFLTAANILREHVRFGVSTNSAVAAAAGVTVPALVGFRSEAFEAPRVEFKGSMTNSEEIRTFATSKALPLAGIYNDDNAKLYALTGLPRVTVWTTVDMENAPKQARYYLNRLRKVAAGYSDKAVFVLQDKKAKEFADLNFDDASFGVGAIGANGLKYKATMDKFSVAALESFANEVTEGKVEAYMKSEPIPETQDGDVTVVVGKTFQELVNDPTKDVLIEFYAPWCGHCKTLEPKYEALAKKMKKHKTLRIAKIDATANDIPPEYNVRGFPTIYLQKNDGSDPISFEGEREVKSFQKFLKKNVSRKLATKKKANKDEL